MSRKVPNAIAGKLATIRELHALGALRVTFPGELEVVFAPQLPTAPEREDEPPSLDEQTREHITRALASAS